MSILLFAKAIQFNDAGLDLIRNLVVPVLLVMETFIFREPIHENTIAVALSVLMVTIAGGQGLTVSTV